MSFVELEVEAFLAQRSSEAKSVLIDVREEYEFDDFNIGGENIPMGEILSRLDEFSDKGNIYLYCKSGKRSKAVAYHLSKELDHCKIITLTGGVEAYKSIHG